MLTATLILAAFIASTLSGVYGMAGGLVLLAVYLALLPVPKVMVLHGLVMLLSNVGRVSVNRTQLMPSVVITGLVLTPLLAFLFIHYTVVLPKALIYLLVGLTSLIVWLPPGKLRIPVNRKRFAAIPTAVSLTFTLALGAAGPVVDAIFLMSGLGRQQIMANKAFLQVLAHASKIIVFGGLTVLLIPHTLTDQYTPILLFGSLAASLAGTWAGTRLLAKMTDNFFRRSSRLLITAIAAYYVAIGITRIIGG